MDEASIAAAALLEAAENNQKTLEAKIRTLDDLIKLLHELPRKVTPELRAAIEQAHRAELAATRQEFQALTADLRYARKRLARSWLFAGAGVVLTAVIAVAALLLLVFPSSRELAEFRAQGSGPSATDVDLEAGAGRTTLASCGNAGETPLRCPGAEPGTGTRVMTMMCCRVVRGH